VVSIHYDTGDPYRIYGINHFIQKYGIQINFNTGSKINIIYGNSSEDTSGFNIQIIENEMQKGISGCLKTDTEEILLFENPIRLNKDKETLAMFVDNEGNGYPGVVLENNGIKIGFDIFNEVGHILSGYLESFWKLSGNKQLAKIPVVDYYEKILFDCIEFASKKSNNQLKYKPFWSDGKKFAVCLTHDVDRVKKTFQYVTHTIRHVKKGEIGLAFTKVLPLLRRENPYWNFEKVMEIERKLDVKSTFFFLNERRRTYLLSPSEWKLYWGRYNIKDVKIVETMKRLDREGWEIGIHGSYNSYRDLKRLEEEKKLLEELLGKKVYGISQHYCNLDIPETWEYHEKLGLAYDSTTGFVTDIGFRWGTCHPFHPFNPAEGKTLSVWEMPIIIMDNACAYKNWKEIMDIVDIVEKHNGLLLLRWHQGIFNEREFPGQANIYRKIIEVCKEKDAWITNAYNIVEWLTMREKDDGKIPNLNIIKSQVNPNYQIPMLRRRGYAKRRN